MKLEAFAKRVQAHWDCAVAYTSQHPGVVLSVAVVCFAGWVVSGLFVFFS